MLGSGQHLQYPFWFGGSASCFAACMTHPLDLDIRACFRNNGFFGLCSGLSASLLRQMTYSTTCFGIYEELKQDFTTQASSPSFPALIAVASASGFLGGVARNPADVLNGRGLEEPLPGCWPNCMRAVLMTASQLASYDGFKRLLVQNASMEDGLTMHFSASFLAGFVATTICSPVDVIESRIMSSQESKGLAKLLADVYRVEGVSWMFRGWVPSFIRLGPHTIAIFLFLEQHKKLYRKLKGIKEADAVV
ncbi:mitochondrial carrier domain-containing protein [Leptodontidium sp. MPI-SDFR-AT-0119]|nr:mitochondrial carrier domain-containing protein [Leptodontidium sp. MPI-SDFR-AT-0119]